jgi:hypothetical protein
MIKIGQHRLMVGDITDGAVAHLMGEERADVIYSDPPWGPGNQQYWHTMRERGSIPRTSWEGFLIAFCRVCAEYGNPGAPIFVEMGVRWVDQLDDAMKAVGLDRSGRWTITYGPKSKPLPNTVSAYGHPAPEFTLPNPPHGEPVTRAILGAVVKPGMVVLDPCTGLGMTARIAHNLGARFRGTEMNAARMARAATWLEAHEERK